MWLEVEVWCISVLRGLYLDSKIRAFEFVIEVNVKV